MVLEWCQLVSVGADEDLHHCHGLLSPKDSLTYSL